MILYRLMQAFPQCRFSVGEWEGRDTWDVGLLHGALPPGIITWLAERNLTAVRRVGHDGYVIRWLRFGPDPERAIFAAVQDAAIRFASIAHGPASEFPMRPDEVTALRHQINAFNAMRMEALL
jgi:hypothetical protein